MKSNYGIVGGINEGVKLVWFIFLKDLIFLGILGGIVVVLGNQFPPNQQLARGIFTLLGVILAVYLDFHSLSNPGKRNYELVWYSLIYREPKIYKSYGYYEFNPKGEE